MRRNLLIAAVVGIALISTAGTANAQDWYNFPVGLSISLTSQAAAAPWDVTVDVNVQTLINVYYGTTTYTTLSTARLGSQWWDSAQLVHFIDTTATTIAGNPFVFPGNRPAMNWDDGAMMMTATVPLIGNGTGAFGGSFSHTFADNMRKDIQVGANNANLISGEGNGVATPLSGSFTDFVHYTSVWATSNGASSNFWWFGGATWFTTAPMGIRDTTAAWAGNIGVVQPIPTVSGIGMLVLAGLLAGLGVFVLTRR
jgi:hypothetical protein